MEATLEAAPEEITRESLLESAHKADQELGIESDSAHVEADRTTAPEPVKPDTEKDGVKPQSSEAKPETAEAKEKRERDEKTGRFKPKADKTAEDKPTDTAYEKARKERERQENLLKNFQADKERARAEIEAEKQAIAQEKAKIQQVYAQQRPEATKDGFTAREYWQAAQDFAKLGDYENAHKATLAFLEVRNYEAQYFAQANQANAHKSYEYNWQQQMNKSFADDPYTDPNSASPLSDTIKQLLEEYPEAFYMKDGFHRVVKIAKRIQEAGSASELREQLKQAQSELEGFKKSTQPAKGGPNSPSSPRGFDQMSTQEQREYLMQEAERRDSEAA